MVGIRMYSRINKRTHFSKIMNTSASILMLSGSVFILSACGEDFPFGGKEDRANGIEESKKQSDAYHEQDYDFSIDDLLKQQRQNASSSELGIINKEHQENNETQELNIENNEEAISDPRILFNDENEKSSRNGLSKEEPDRNKISDIYPPPGPQKPLEAHKLPVEKNSRPTPRMPLPKKPIASTEDERENAQYDQDDEALNKDTESAKEKESPIGLTFKDDPSLINNEKSNSEPDVNNQDRIRDALERARRNNNHPEQDAASEVQKDAVSIPNQASYKISPSEAMFGKQSPLDDSNSNDKVNNIFSMPSPLFAQYDPNHDFIEKRSDLENSIADNINSDTEFPNAALNLAEFFLSYSQPQEAMSVIEELKKVSPDFESERLIALEEISHLMRHWNGNGEFKIVSNDHYEKWDDWLVWSSLNDSKDENWSEAAEKLTNSTLQRIFEYPEAVKKDILPYLIESSLLGGGDNQHNFAKNAILHYEELASTPEERTELPYLIGLTAETMDEFDTAAKSYAAAAKGEGRAAQKAKISLVDLGIMTGSMTNAEAERILSDTANSWRGDKVEMDTLKRLAIIRNELGDKKGASIALAKLISGFPDHHVADQARDRIIPLLDEIYVYNDETFSLSEWNDTHSELEHYLNDDPSFMSYRKKHADLMRDIGLTSEAARSYGNIADLLSGEDAIEYRIKAANSMIDGGDYGRFILALDDIDGIVPSSLEESYRNTWLRIADKVEQSEDYIDYLNEEGDTLEGLILRGHIYWDKEDWDNVARIYSSISKNFEEHFSGKELLRYLLALYRTERASEFSEVSQRYADLIQGAEWKEIANSLVSDPPSISPLGGDDARKILNEAQNVADMVKQAAFNDNVE